MVGKCETAALSRSELLYVVTKRGIAIETNIGCRTELSLLNIWKFKLEKFWNVRYNDFVAAFLKFQTKSNFFCLYAFNLM